jgi:hypothetical protein
MIVSTQKNYFISLYLICLARDQHIFACDMVPLDCIYIPFDKGYATEAISVLLDKTFFLSYNCVIL